MLVQEDVLLLKIWLHLSKKVQRKKLDKLGADPTTRWRVSARDWSFHMRYDEFRTVCDYALQKTSSQAAPWRVVEATNKRYRRLTVGGIVLDALKERLAAPPRESSPAPADHDVPKPDNVLRRLDLGQSISRKKYQRRMTELQGRLNRLSRHLSDKEHSMVLVFEGTDAAGKGGTIRRVKRAFDARYVRVIPIAAPTDEEKARPYLWRFWRHIPPHGRTVIFDRSWYGRVLVERVEGFCSPDDWERAYEEINAFERQLSEAGAIVVKFWLAISKEEQLARFQAREATGFKRWKLTDEDWRNRAKWDAYEAAICDMVERTHTEQSPWVLVEANDKPFARVKVLQTITDILAERLGIKGQPLSEGGLATMLA
jgi:polyphosphate:AMP phosphotransferase